MLLRFFKQFNYTNLVFFEDTSDLFYHPMSDVFGISMALYHPQLRYTSKTVQFDSSVSQMDDYRSMLIQAQQISRGLHLSRQLNINVSFFKTVCFCCSLYHFWRFKRCSGLHGIIFSLTKTSVFLIYGKNDFPFRFRLSF